MKITLLLLGQPFKNEPEKALFEIYQKRAQQLGCKLTISHKGPLPSDAYIIHLDERGQNLTTTVLAQKMEEWAHWHKNIVFIVGDAYGIPPEFTPHVHEKISFGAMTWPHKLVRVMLMEQIYRIYTLFHNKPYHHG